MLQQLYGSANRNLVMRATNYSERTHYHAVTDLKRKGAIENLREHVLPAHRRRYISTIARYPHASP
jgi:hypothetical protein